MGIEALVWWLVGIGGLAVLIAEPAAPAGSLLSAA
jgi:hypothetical protein